MNNHLFCRHLLVDARRKVRVRNVSVPANINAMRCTDKLFFVQGIGEPGTYIKACCGFEAKAKHLLSFIGEEDTQ